MSSELEGIRFAKSIDLSKVHGTDRVYVRDILVRVLDFHNPMPKLNVDIYDAGDHYNIALKGWNSEIDDETWYEKFVNKKNRETTFDRITSTGTIPTTDDGVSVKIIRISKSTFSKSKRNK